MDSDANAAEAARRTTPESAVGWRPIETAPQDGTVVLLCEFLSKYPLYSPIATGRWTTKDLRDEVDENSFWGWFTTDHKNGPIHLRGLVPTHWMPLPPLPTPPP
jgi:hypothetical protein